MHRILFVCHGNICRSPMAEYVLKDLVAKKHIAHEFVIDSAATSTEEIGNDVHRKTRQILLENNVFCGHREAIRVRREDYENYDLILLMDLNNARNIKRIISEDPQAKIHLLLDFTNRSGDIADPWYTGNFQDTYEDVVLGCEGLLKHLGY